MADETGKSGGPAAGDSLPTVGPKGGTGTPPNPTGRQTHADHSGVAEKRKEVSAQRERRRSRSGGNLSGKWHPIGGSIVNLDTVTKIDLPTEGEEPYTLTLTHFGGGTTVASGDEAREFMEEFGLLANEASKNDPAKTVTESGRIVAEKDLEAERKFPDRHKTVPNHQHGANAVLTQGQTDFDRGTRTEAAGGVVPRAPNSEAGGLPGKNKPEEGVDGSKETTTPGGEKTEGETAPESSKTGSSFDSDSESGETADNTPEDQLTPAQKAARTRAKNKAAETKGRK